MHVPLLLRYPSSLTFSKACCNDVLNPIGVRVARCSLWFTCLTLWWQSLCSSKFGYTLSRAPNFTTEKDKKNQSKRDFSEALMHM